MSDTYSGNRPLGVTVLSVLTLLIGVTDIIAGLLFVFTRNNREVQASAQTSAEVLLIAGVVYLVIGLIYLAVARGLWQGSNGSRIVVNVVSVINLAAGVWLLTQSAGSTRLQAAISILLAVILLLIVNSGRAKAFFLAR
ncbi:hypothetical protein [Humibacillus xanthopallidus]|uniref:Uncharacterized protein n=1 Tax=Humibacillus xanthopallidus TaxID=412689 RepID=A0A543I1U0_9MICO|nr:hypothetical protein [Humibacillus xanthopallidus]TQM64521.1 hypothetical protein FBY41_0889 [Humibacillus xanthopallidus]